MEGMEDEVGLSRMSFPEDLEDRILEALEELRQRADIWEGLFADLAALVSCEDRSQLVSMITIVVGESAKVKGLEDEVNRLRVECKRLRGEVRI